MGKQMGCQGPLSPILILGKEMRRQGMCGCRENPQIHFPLSHLRALAGSQMRLPFRVRSPDPTPPPIPYSLSPRK